MAEYTKYINIFNTLLTEKNSVSISVNSERTAKSEFRKFLEVKDELEWLFIYFRSDNFNTWDDTGRPGLENLYGPYEDIKQLALQLREAGILFKHCKKDFVSVDKSQEYGITEPPHYGLKIACDNSLPQDSTSQPLYINV